MKKIGIIIFVLALLVGVIFANFISFGKVETGIFNFSFKRGVKGSGNVVTEDRNVTGFKSVEVGGIFHVEITARKDFSVQVEADDNLLQYIKTEVNNGVLEIRNQKKINTRGRIMVRITAPDIERVDAFGVAKVSISDLKNSSLTLDTSGASKITVAGETRDLAVDVSGASKIDGGSLAAVNAVIGASGASNVSVNLSGELQADASGASKIYYSGTPTNIHKKTSGTARVVAR
jgi:hypothetical protein